MRRTLPLAALLALGWGGASASAQVLDDALVPRGLARFEISPVYTSWGSRFGRTSTGTEQRELLGDDLTAPSADALFPGAESLRAAIAAMSGNPAYAPMLGRTQARVTHDITRVEFGAQLGVFEWLTIGAVLPWTRTRTNLDVHFWPDTLTGDLGRNPGVTNGVGVSNFLSALSGAQSAAQGRATSICSASPGSGACASAQSLADRATTFHASAVSAYGASPFFPIAATAAGSTLAQAVTTLSTDLIAAGLGGIAPPMPFATQRVGEQDLWELPPEAGSRVEAIEPLGSVRGLWHAGDVEVSATVRLLEGEVGGAPDAPPSFTYRLLATALGRLPTGQVDSVDVLLDVGTGDGQADLEGRLLGQFTVGSRIGLHVGGRYGIQRPRTLLRRVAPPEVVLSAGASRRLVEWTPGPYFGLEVAPVLRVSDELSFAAEYRAFRKYRDDYELTATSVGAPVDPSVLEVESGVTLHEVGGTLRYDTVSRWRSEGARPIQVNLRVVRAVAGGGGQTPVTTQLEFGARFFRRIWGSR